MAMLTTPSGRGPGNDHAFGGLGSDTASYQSSSTAVEAGIYTNIAAGEGSDVLLAIENLTGSPLADKLTGSLVANRMKGLGGADELRGRNGKDRLSGGLGADRHFGESGNDTLGSRDGVNGNDSLDGGLNTDTCRKDKSDKPIISCEQ
jgi:Ca2+-binding RTX toxin-like protein